MPIINDCLVNKGSIFVFICVSACVCICISYVKHVLEESVKFL